MWMKSTRENLRFLRKLLTMIPVLVPLKWRLTKTLLRVATVALMLTVMAIFPLVVSLLVPMMTGVLRLCMQVMELLRPLKAWHRVAGTPRWVTSRPVKLPEFLTRVVVPPGLKVPTLVVVKLLMSFLTRGILGLMNV